MRDIQKLKWRQGRVVTSDKKTLHLYFLGVIIFKIERFVASVPLSTTILKVNIYSNMELL